MRFYWRYTICQGVANCYSPTSGSLIFQFFLRFLQHLMRRMDLILSRLQRATLCKPSRYLQHDDTMRKNLRAPLKIKVSSKSVMRSTKIDIYRNESRWIFLGVFSCVFFVFCNIFVCFSRFQSGVTHN